MSRVAPESVERVRVAADIVEIISGHTELRRRGARWTGLCPFHDERTPSFSVDPTANLYYCFGVGYAPSAWDRVLVRGLGAGFSEDELRAAGLIQQGRRGGFYDRFRGRVMFPLRDARGRVLGFGARALQESRPPKYVNSPESSIYHKGRSLFGLDLARPHATKAVEVIVVEGYTDVLALHQAGMKNSV